MKPLAWLAWLGLPLKGLYLHELVKEIWSPLLYLGYEGEEYPYLLGKIRR
jgi:hypothetical protein